MIEAFPGAWKTRKGNKLIDNLEEAAAVSFFTSFSQGKLDSYKMEQLDKSYRGASWCWPARADPCPGSWTCVSVG